MTSVATPCQQKGPDPHATRRLAAFFKICGISQFNYLCDQEGAMRTMMEHAIEVTKARGEWLGAIPENSPVGESRSNGRAERAVQQVEDHVRTHLGELEERIGQPLKPDNPILSWLVEYVAVLLNKYHPQEGTSETAYQAMHGKEAEERLAYFAETV